MCSSDLFRALFEVVTVDEGRRASSVVATRETSDPHRDLWWAHTGAGGGNFGVVTRYWFRSPGTSGADPAVVLGYVVARFVALLGVSSWLGAVHFGVFLWIGFPLILLTGSVLWENVLWKVAAIHAGDWLVKMLVIPLIVSAWP